MDGIFVAPVITIMQLRLYLLLLLLASVAYGEPVTRPATLEDIPHLMEIDRQSFDVPWERETWEKFVKDTKGSLVYVRTDGEKPVGVIVGRGSGRSLEIFNLAVLPEARRKGHGSELLFEVKAELLRLSGGQGVGNIEMKMDRVSDVQQAFLDSHGFFRNKLQPSGFHLPVPDPSGGYFRSSIFDPDWSGQSWHDFFGLPENASMEEIQAAAEKESEYMPKEMAYIATNPELRPLFDYSQREPGAECQRLYREIARGLASP